MGARRRGGIEATVDQDAALLLLYRGVRSIRRMIESKSFPNVILRNTLAEELPS